MKIDKRNDTDFNSQAILTMEWQLLKSYQFPSLNTTHKDKGRYFHQAVIQISCYHCQTGKTRHHFADTLFLFLVILFL